MTSKIKRNIGIIICVVSIVILWTGLLDISWIKDLHIILGVLWLGISLAFGLYLIIDNAD